MIWIWTPRRDGCHLFDRNQAMKDAPYHPPKAPATLLRRFGLKPKDWHGQNFLANPGVAEKIANLTVHHSTENVVEVGAGMGHLTCALASRARTVVALELDPDMVEVLQHTTRHCSNVTVVLQDAATADYPTLFAHLEGPMTVAGNLPFHRSADILFALLEGLPKARRMVLMFQRELAQRITAEHGSRIFGALTVNTAVRATVNPCFHVNPGSFYPAPKVQASVVELIPKTTPPLDSCCMQVLGQILRAAFGQRRKAFRNALKGHRRLWDAVQRLDLEAMGIKPSHMRAEHLSVDQYIQLARAVCHGKQTSDSPESDHLPGQPTGPQDPINET